MKPPIFTPLGQNDLRRITRESVDLFGVLQARIYYDRLTAATFALAADPRRGRRFDEAHPHYLRFNVGAHAIIYRVREDGRVVIVRVLHSRMDLPSHL